MAKFFRDLFMGVGGQSWELARILSAWAVLSYSAAFLHSVFWLREKVDWSALGLGYAAVLTGAGAMIGIKDFARAKALPAEADNAGGPVP
jgi:hypothetical protein